MRLLHPAVASAIAVALLLPVSRAAAAPPKPQVRTLLADADRAMKAKQWGDAITALRQARKLEPGPAVDLKLGEALAASGKLVEARKVIAPIVEGKEATPAAKRAREAAKKALAALTARIATVEVTIAGPPEGSAITQIDGLDVDGKGEIPVNPGQHTVGASADGFEPAEKEVSFEEGAHERVELKLASKSPPAAAAVESKSEAATESKHGSRVPGVTVVIIGAADLIAGGILGGIALKAGSDARAQCSGNVCPPAASADLNSARTFGNASTAVFVAGGAITAAGIVLIIAAPGDASSSSARVSPWIGPRGGGMGLTGTF
jgi:hypothetical protein